MTATISFLLRGAAAARPAAVLQQRCRRRALRAARGRGGPLAPGRAPLRTDVSCTVFLSDPADYAGGELSIVDAYGTHEVKLPPGDAIVYPATSVHEVLPVTHGERLAAFLWVQSMVCDDAKRAMLFELDTNIQALRARLGEGKETVGLVGHYHNLLRMWAET